MDTPKLKIIYCMGAGRSGSTVLSIILGSHPNIIGAGELQNVERVFLNNEYCSCGDKIKDCTFWSRVFGSLNKNLSDESISNLFASRQQIENFKSPLAWLKLLFNYPGQKQYINNYYFNTYQFFASIMENSDKKIIVDISKNPLRALALYKNPYIDLKLIHLVRDGRSLAWSLSKSHKINKKAGLEKEQKSRPVWRTALFWLIVNRQGNFVRKKIGNARLIRYEDLTLHPDETIQNISDFAQFDEAPILRNIHEGIALPIAHVMSGNKLRMAKKINLKFNDEWKANMDVKDQNLFYTITSSTMSLYGYKK